MSTIYHAHAEKRWAKEQILRFGAHRVIGLDVDIATACQYVDELETEFVPIGACENRDPKTGVCRGHWRPDVVHSRR